MRRPPNRQRRYIHSAIVLCGVFLAVSALFLFSTLRQSQQEALRYLTDAANQSQTAVTTQLEGDFQTLEGIAICLGDAGISDPGQLSRLLEKINDHNSFLRMGLAGIDGIADLVDMDGRHYPDQDFSATPFFQTALSGSRVVSRTIPDIVDPEHYVNYYAVPVRDRGDELAGVLCAVGSADSLREIVDAPLLGGRGVADLVDADGTLAIRSLGSHIPVDALAEPFALMGVPASEQARIRAALAAEEGTSFTFTLEGAEYLAVLDPVGISGWSLLATAPRSALQAQYSRTLLGAALLVVLACAIFALLLFQQRRIMAVSQQELIRLAYTDGLTGCWNYPKFLEAAPGFLRGDGHKYFAVWYCDLKKFKYFNDVFGYHTGDDALRHLACLLEQAVAGRGLFCRVSADNFAGILAYDSPGEPEAWFARLVEGLHRPAPAKDLHDAYTELSLGFYAVTPQEWELSVNDMVNRANMAQKSVKPQPGSRCAWFTQTLREQSLLETELESEGRAALERGEFLLYLQPKVDIQNGDRITGAECLVRWRHPEKGLIPPGQFIPIFEDSGLIVDLDRYMFDAACRWYRAHMDRGGPPVSLAVNVSRLGLLREDLVSHYAAVKERWGIPDGVLELEFTESVFLGDDGTFLATVQALQAKGFICSMDDFGSGYSSLNLLKNLPINILKLDILFFQNSVDQQRERVVISHVINMARELSIRIVAEGVEDRETVEFLRQAGCDVIQGYIFARPMPSGAFERLLDERGDGAVPMDEGI